MTSRKTLYLANPYGFSAQQRGGPLTALVAALEAMGAEIWEPFARNNQVDRTGTRLGLADRAGRPSRRARGGRAVCGGQRLSSGRGGDGGAWHGDRLGKALVPVP